MKYPNVLSTILIGLFFINICFSQTEIRHLDENHLSHHISTIIHYKSWNEQFYFAKIIDGKFIHSAESSFPPYPKSWPENGGEFIDYIGWDGKKWRTKINGHFWYHAPEGDFNKVHISEYMDYMGGFNDRWTATFLSYNEIIKLKPPPPPPPPLPPPPPQKKRETKKSGNWLNEVPTYSVDKSFSSKWKVTFNQTTKVVVHLPNGTLSFLTINKGDSLEVTNGQWVELWRDDKWHRMLEVDRR